MCHSLGDGGGGWGAGGALAALRCTMTDVRLSTRVLGMAGGRILDAVEQTPASIHKFKRRHACTWWLVVLVVHGVKYWASSLHVCASERP